MQESRKKVIITALAGCFYLLFLYASHWAVSRLGWFFTCIFIVVSIRLAKIKVLGNISWLLLLFSVSLIPMFEWLAIPPLYWLLLVFYPIVATYIYLLYGSKLTRPDSDLVAVGDKKEGSEGS